MTRYKKWIHEVKGLRLDCFEECLPSYDGYETFYCFMMTNRKPLYIQVIIAAAAGGSL